MSQGWKCSGFLNLGSIFYICDPIWEFEIRFGNLKILWFVNFVIRFGNFEMLWFRELCDPIWEFGNALVS
jgi:hypothetical protein